MPRRTIGLAAVFLCLTLLLGACNGGDEGDNGGGEETPVATLDTPVATTAPPTAEPTAGGEPVDLRSTDLTVQEDLQSFLIGSNGEVDPSRIIYADLTEDGTEDAVVPVSSGGEGGDIAVFVYTSRHGPPELLLRVLPEAGQLAANVEGTDLIVEEPSFAAGDPLCCPSEILRTTYSWDGDSLRRSGQETVPAEN